MAKKMRGLYRRGKIWWMAYTDTSGKVDRESCKTENKKEAETILSQRRIQVAKAEPGTSIRDNPLFLSAVKDLYAGCLTNKYSRQGADRAFRALIKVLGDVDIHTLTPLLVQKYINSRHNNDQVSNSTIRADLTSLKAALNKCVELELYSEDQLMRLKKVRGPKADPVRLRYLEVHEVQRLLECSPANFQPVEFLSICTGLRRSEACFLAWPEVDLNEGYIHLPETKNLDRRDIPLMDIVVTMLRAIRKTNASSKHVFLNGDGTAFKPTTVDHLFITSAGRAGVENAHYHDTRDTFASWCVMGGLDLRTVQCLLGHKKARPPINTLICHRDMRHNSFDSWDPG